MNDDESAVECDYCGREELAYELQSDRGPVVRCIPCLAIERGQPSIGWEGFRDYPDHLQQHTFEDAADWLTVLARIVDDDALVERDPVGPPALEESTRTFLTNIMGSDAHHPPSEVAGSAVDIAQCTLDNLGDDEDEVYVCMPCREMVPNRAGEITVPGGTQGTVWCPWCNDKMEPKAEVDSA